ncbi:MAG: hypothetical protein HUU21_04995 [Polyangiaceae bacterium]|nr:hypothetical protein [Polyangiaceae bacterium]
MTALRLGENRTDSPQHAVVGECTKQNAVSHVGILVRRQPIKDGESVAVYHMANPRDRLQLPGAMNAHAAAWLVDLIEHEHGRIENWLEEFETSAIEIEYSAFPANDVIVDKATGRPIGRKFSCAGFVQACYQEALGVRLIVPKDELPEVERGVLQLVWPAPLVTRGRQYGLVGPGPWKVLLPSYLFHALSKKRAELPHKPLHPDPYFPAQP